MKPHVSLASVLAAVMLFAIGVVMHEAVRAESLLGHGVTAASVAEMTTD